jgi:hypothetical protein
MPDNNSVPSIAEVAALFEYAGVNVTAERLEEKCDTYASTLALIRKASVPSLGETVPAVGFKASWV